MIQIAKIVRGSYVDGPGKRTAVFMQGCLLECPGCQNPSLWDSNGGTAYVVEALAQHVAMLANVETGGQVTISGGEPFLQPYALLEFLQALRLYDVSHIIVYSGFTWDMLRAGWGYPWEVKKANAVLAAVWLCDVIVDGPFIKSKDDDLVQWRGSRNQRPIDVQASLMQGRVITLDWDSPTITITESGDLVLPVGLAGKFSGAGAVGKSRMCGQTS